MEQPYTMWCLEEFRPDGSLRQYPVFAYTAEDAKQKGKQSFGFDPKNNVMARPVKLI